MDGANLVWDGAGFLIIVKQGVTSANARLFWTKGYDFSTLTAASYPALGIAGGAGAPRWGHAVRFSV